MARAEAPGRGAADRKGDGRAGGALGLVGAGRKGPAFYLSTAGTVESGSEVMGIYDFMKDQSSC